MFATQGLPGCYLWSQQKKSWTKSATFQLHAKHPFHWMLTIFILLHSFPATRPCKGVPERGTLMTKLPYDFMTQSYGSVSWQSYGDSVQCGHLSPSRGGSCPPLLLRRPWQFPRAGAAHSQPKMPGLVSCSCTHATAGYCTQRSAFCAPHTKYLRPWNTLFLKLLWKKSALTTTPLFKGFSIKNTIVYVHILPPQLSSHDNHKIIWWFPVNLEWQIRFLYVNTGYRGESQVINFSLCIYLPAVWQIEKELENYPCGSSYM